MNGRQLSDAQISRALQAHLPERAAAGLRERILDTAGTTTQQRPLPSFLGALTDADPVTRRGSLLIAAALLLGLVLASAAAAGALRLLDPNRDLSLEPPADLPAFVLSSYERLPQLPPLALTWHDGGSDKGRVYVDRSGAVRFDRFASADAKEPSSYTILSGSRISGMAPVESEAVWVEPGDEAFGDDPRVFLRTVLNAAEGPGCEVERDPSAVGSGTAATGWRWVGVEYVAGRPTHHVACLGELSLDIDLWLDIETRLILRTREPATDDAGQPIPGQFGTTEVTEITFGEQPAALFGPPDGVAHMPSEAYSAYLCTRDVVTEEEVGFATRECATPEAEATPLPTPTPVPTGPPSLGPGPSGPAGPLAWSQASLKEDWPAPVRAEPAGGAILVPIQLPLEGDPEECCRIADPVGDTGSDAYPWVDIREFEFCTQFCLGLRLASNQPPVVDPAEQWIAYGVVVDDDGDGVPDRRIGIDNIPQGEEGDHRPWTTDLHTGRTIVGWHTGSVIDSFYPPTSYRSDAHFTFGGDVTGGGTKGSTPERFYVWASVIQGGRVVATDYAPDAGWLDTSPDAKP